MQISAIAGFYSHSINNQSLIRKSNFINFTNNIEDSFEKAPDDIPEKRIQRIQKIAQKALDTAPTILDEAQNLQKESQNVRKKGLYELSKVQKKAAIIKSVIERAKENRFEPLEYDNNTVTFKKKDGELSNMIMEETDNDSKKLIRRTEFNPYSMQPLVIEEYTKKEGTNRYQMATYADSFVLKISKGINKKQGAEVTQKEYSYSEQGKLKRFVKNKKVLADGSEIKAEHWYFSDNELRYFSKNQKDNIDGSFAIEKDFEFEDGKLVNYRKDVSKAKGNLYQTGESYGFKQDSLRHFLKVQPLNENLGTEHFDYDNETLSRYYNNSEVINF